MGCGGESREEGWGVEGRVGRKGGVGCGGEIREEGWGVERRVGRKTEGRRPW